MTGGLTPDATFEVAAARWLRGIRRCADPWPAVRSPFSTSSFPTGPPVRVSASPVPPAVLERRLEACVVRLALHELLEVRDRLCVLSLLQIDLRPAGLFRRWGRENPSRAFPTGRSPPRFSLRLETPSQAVHSALCFALALRHCSKYGLAAAGSPRLSSVGRPFAAARSSGVFFSTTSGNASRASLRRP